MPQKKLNLFQSPTSLIAKMGASPTKVSRCEKANSQQLTSLTRRSFLLGSALSLGTSALEGLDVHTLPEKDTAIPRGKIRNLLAHQCSPEELQQSLIPLEGYKPYPQIGDPTWSQIHPKSTAALLTEGERFLHFNYEAPSATLFLEYVRAGIRSDYEQVRSANLVALRALTFAECVENKGRFVDDIVNGVWSICEQSFWGVPAHLYIQKKGLGLPDPLDPIVDLFAADTAAELARVVFLVGDRLDSINPLITERVYVEAERRIFDPLLSQNLMWMGLPGAKRRDDLPWDATPDGKVQPVNNWDAWICWNWITTALLLDRNPSRRIASVQKAMVCLDNFLNSYPDDGGCDEGCTYWNRAAGAMFEGLEMLGSATNNHVNIWHEPLLRRMGEYIVEVRIADNLYVNYGDAHSHQDVDRDLLFRFGKRVDSPLLLALATADFPENYKPRTLEAIFGEKALCAELPRPSPLLKDVWLPQTKFMAARMQENSPEGPFLAGILSDNGKSHSHNDTGSFWVYLDGEPVIIDLGGESYTKQSFDAHRYEILSTGSAYHNLPTIGTVQQGIGSTYRATRLNYMEDGTLSSLEMSLVDAYPVDAHLREWIRTVELNRKSRQISVRDRFALQSAPTEITWSFMTCREVKADSGKLHLIPRSEDRSAAMTLEYNPVLLMANVETVKLLNPGLISAWGSVVYRVLLKTQRPVTGGESLVVFRPTLT